MDKSGIKNILFALGADLCGVASLDRFGDAPNGFHPTDVMPSCKSVISFACRFPIGTLRCKSAIPYTRVRNSMTPQMDAIALDFCIEMEKHGIVCVPIPTNESLWDSKTNRFRSIISQKHAAQAAGLGTIGRHSLLITPQYGSMVWLGAVLSEQEFEPDPLLTPVCNNCNLCVEICPINALSESELKQLDCWNHAFGDDKEQKIWKISCHKCRDICPYNLGSKNKL